MRGSGIDQEAGVGEKRDETLDYISKGGEFWSSSVMMGDTRVKGEESYPGSDEPCDFSYGHADECSTSSLNRPGQNSVFQAKRYSVRITAKDWMQDR